MTIAANIKNILETGNHSFPSKGSSAHDTNHEKGTPTVVANTTP